MPDVNIPLQGYLNLVLEHCHMSGIPIFGLPAEMPFLNIEDDMGSKDILAQIGFGVVDVLHLALNAAMSLLVHGAGVRSSPDLGIVVANDGFHRRNQLAHVIGGEVLGHTGDFLVGQLHDFYSFVSHNTYSIPHS